MPTIRPYRPIDLPAVVDICVRTAADGGDATGAYADDSLPAAVYATPYVLLEPELAFVLDDGARAVGYILGTADTARFVQRYRADYLPAAGRRHPMPADDDTSGAAALIRGLHCPERMNRPEFAGYPAHLHIDLLPAAQGGGNGRALMATFLDVLRGRGIPGVHLGMSAANVNALGFYRRLGFTELPFVSPGNLYLGLNLTANPPENRR